MRKAGAALITALLITAAAGAQIVNFAGANPSMYMYPINPHTVLFVYAPENYTTQKVKWLNIDFSVNVSEWYGWGVPIFNPSYSFSSSITCYLDSNPVWHKTLSSTKEYNYYSAPLYNFSFTLNNLSDGLHNIEVNATTVGAHYTSEPWKMSNEPVVNSSGVIFFTVDTAPPNLTILGLENKTYYTSDIELEFIASEPSDVTYSLDGNENVTLFQNVVLYRLTSGKHNTTFFALDKAGNAYFKTIYFTVTEPFPTVLVAGVSAASIASAAAGLLLFTRRRRRKEAQQT